MWFDKRKRPGSVTEQTSEEGHWPTERMILHGHADYATPGDLEGLDTGLLRDIAQICEVEEYAPEECIPCLAGTMVIDRIAEAKERLDNMAPHETPEDTKVLPEQVDWEAEGAAGVPEDVYTVYNHPTEPDPWYVLRSNLEALQQQLDMALNGPPIPPKDISLEELAALVIGAEKWVKLVDAQGLELAPEQEAVKEEIQRIVAKVRPAGS